MEQPSQTSKKRSGTVAGMKDGLKKATTDMLVLFLLRQKPMYAYEMLQEMARLSDGVLQFNTLYCYLSATRARLHFTVRNRCYGE